MSRKPQVLVVVRSASFAEAITRSLDVASCEVTTVHEFAAAKARIDLEPDLVVTELRLGEYNGLHLALRAGSRNIPVVVVGDPDMVLEQEAQKLGATFLYPWQLTPAALQAFISATVARNRVAWIHARPAASRAVGRA